MADIKIPSQVIFPLPQNEREAEIFRALDEYFNQIRQTLIEMAELIP